MNILSWVFILSAGLWPMSVAVAAGTVNGVYQSIEVRSDRDLHRLYRSSAELGDVDIESRIHFFATIFLNKNSPYLANPLGEGAQSGPLYRFDSFDCTTFVETVISLARSSNENQFKESMNQIRYENGEISFYTRNHFPTVDWIPNNVRAGFVKDITSSVAGSLTKTSETLIEKDEWYRKKGDHYVQVAEGFGKTLAQIPYFAKEDILEHPELLEHIPSGSVFNIVRPNWDLRKSIGTRLDVSHQGFLIRENGILYMVHASNGASRDGSDNSKRVKRDVFIEYVRNVMMASPSTAGFNLLQVLPR